MNSRIGRRQFLLHSMALMIALAERVRAQPAEYPARPLRIVAGGAGSVTDIRARWLAERLAAALGQPVIVENNGAAGGIVSAVMVARAAPDGYTLLLTHQGIAATNPHLYASPGYDPLKDFVAVARFGIGAQLLVVPASSPIRNVVDLVSRARTKPGALNFGSPGAGTPPHLATVQLMRMADLDAVHVPYKGGGALMTALLASEIDFAMEGLTATLPQVKAGRLRALAVTTSSRVPALPDVPTVSEAGVPGYEFIGWTGVVAPAGTPAVVVDRLNREINRIASSDEGRSWFAETGSSSGVQAPQEFAAFMSTEYTKMGELVRTAKVRVE